MKLIDGIGGTEMLHIYISAAEADIRPGATGKPLLGYEAKVVDEEGRDLPANQVGRLAVRGPIGCRYLADPRQTRYVQGGWNFPGDSFLVDDDGYFWYRARSDDMIVSAGYNIAGPEVEAALLSHPAVAECGVVAAPDEARGAIVKAYVVLRADAEAPSPALVKRAAGPCQGGDRALQISARDRISGRAAEDLVRKIAALRASRDGGRAQALETAPYPRRRNVCDGVSP